MVLLSLFNTAGFIFGPLMFLAGVVAIVLCFRASREPSALPLRCAVYGSLSPLVIGIAGAMVGLGLFLSSNAPGGIRDEHLVALGKVILSGLVVSAIPMLWCLMLLRPRVV